MQITKKGYKKLLCFYAFSFFIAGAFVLFYALYKSSEAYRGVVIILSMAFFVFGFFNLFRFIYCTQKKSYKLDIKEGRLILDNKSFELQDSFLFFKLKKCTKELVKLSCYQERDAEIMTIFTDILFSKEELEAFLELIKPYRKFDAFPWRDYSTLNKLYLCKKGFIFDGREFFYDEIESTEWENRHERFVSGTIIFVDVTIKLKNSQIIKNSFLKDDGFIYVKLTYLNLKIKKEGEMKRIEGNPVLSLKFYQMLDEIEESGCDTLKI